MANRIGEARGRVGSECTSQHRRQRMEGEEVMMAHRKALMERTQHHRQLCLCVCAGVIQSARRIERAASPLGYLPCWRIVSSCNCRLLARCFSLLCFLFFRFRSFSLKTRAPHGSPHTHSQRIVLVSNAPTPTRSHAPLLRAGKKADKWAHPQTPQKADR